MLFQTDRGTLVLFQTVRIWDDERGKWLAELQENARAQKAKMTTIGVDHDRR